ncbi:unnamed protein product [Phytomonas sp. Hart1]|nr:unnamed protein product [Phytomonas sp. Hart1]|eukprot:CCW68050.1 unnamed protein product [Phytomonas sp. isolate Hart1]
MKLKPLLFNVLVVLLLSHIPSVTASASDTEKYRSESIPTLLDILSQDFEVSVITQSFGVFNASLHIQGSPNFKGHLYGELIPHGDLMSTMDGDEGDAVGTLPHFSRMREQLDDELSGLTASMETASKSKVSNGPPVKKERPTLLVFDGVVQGTTFKQRPSVEFTAFYLSEEPEALRKGVDMIQEGVALPTAKTEMHFRPTRPSMTRVLLSDVPEFARISSAVLNLPTDSPTKPSRKGSITINFFSEHEFMIDLWLPRSLWKGGSSTEEEGDEERVWVHGYAPISSTLSPRVEVKRPWWMGPTMVFVFVATFALQIVVGILDGKQKKMKRENQNGAVATAEKKEN